MTTTKDARDIFEDAKQLYYSAVEQLDAGDIRDAAEKAWGATKRATDALILARTGAEPERTPETARELKRLASIDPQILELNLLGRYYHVQGSLHGGCFYSGICNPEVDGPHIRRVIEYIDHVESLAF